MASKKRHPLEIFKKHGSMPTLEGKPAKGNSRQSAVKERKTDARSNRITKGLPGPTKARGAKKVVAPGDRRFSLSMNGVLFIGLGIAGLALITYFLGYQTGLTSPEDLDSKPALRRDVQSDGQKPQRSVEKKVMPQNSLRVVEAYGVQAGTWENNRKETAREANTWLREKGFDSVLYPLKNEEGWIIIIGSFSDRNDPGLEGLLSAVRSIDDYPYGASAPFKDARIRQYKVEKSQKL
jgi:hypothetical protein